MQTFHSAKKLIAVCDKKGNTISILKSIMNFCNRENYVVASIEAFPKDAQPTVLLICDAGKNTVEEDFPVCVADYAFSEVPEIIALKPVTYSISSDEADFTAKNIRKISDEILAFEIIGVGVIGRVRLAVKGKKAYKIKELAGATLAASSAAISFGIPFAEVLNALNNIQIDN